MLSRRDFVKTSLRWLLADRAGADRPRVPRPDGRAAAPARRPRPGRRPARRRQRRHQHGRPASRRGLCQNRKALRLDARATDQGQRTRRPASRLEQGGQAAGARPAGDRAGRRLSQPEPVALREHGDLAVGPARPGGTRGPGLARPRPSTSGSRRGTPPARSSSAQASRPPRSTDVGASRRRSTGSTTLRSRANQACARRSARHPRATTSAHSSAGARSTPTRPPTAWPS